MKKLLLLLLIAGCATIAFFYDYAIHQPMPVDRDILFLVQKGDSLNKIAKKLKEYGLIKNEYLLEELVELQRYLQDIADHFFYNTFAIRLVDDGDNKLIQKEFDIVKEYIDAY